MRKNMIAWLFLAISVAILANGCTALTKVTDIISNPTPREIYQRTISAETVAATAWNVAYENALSDSLEVPMPYGEKGIFNSKESVVYSYVIHLNSGEKVRAEIKKNDSAIAFMEFYEWDGTSWQLAETTANGQTAISFGNGVSTTCKLLIQPAIGAEGRFFIGISKLPVYGFPVAGKGNDAIQSFWADVRDGGKRSHEGVDIFAKRGTPVVAVTDGTVSYSGEKGLGGKQVWQRTGLFGNHIYYAHLDKIAVEEGTSVKCGDTIGFVGNTGNAEGCPPHLHFGIYQGFGGAVNPLPFIYKTEKISEKLLLNPALSSSIMQITTPKANLRQAPSSNSQIIGELSKGDRLVVLGQANDWLHIQVPGKKTAFLHKTLAQSL